MVCVYVWGQHWINRKLINYPGQRLKLASNRQIFFCFCFYTCEARKCWWVKCFPGNRLRQRRMHYPRPHKPTQRALGVSEERLHAAWHSLDNQQQCRHALAFFSHLQRTLGRHWSGWAVAWACSFATNMHFSSSCMKLRIAASCCLCARCSAPDFRINNRSISCIIICSLPHALTLAHSNSDYTVWLLFI